MLDRFKTKHAVSIAPETIIFTILFILGLYFVYQVRSIITLVLLAFILMVALRPIVLSLHEKLRLPILPSIVIAYLLMIVVVVGIGAILIPPLFYQMYQLLKMVNIPVLSEEIRNFNFTIMELGNLAERVSGSVGVVFSIINSTFSGVFTLFTLIVLSLYMMFERNTLYLKLSWFSKDPDHLIKARGLIDSIEEQLGGWVRGQAILMVVIGLLTYIGLSLLSVPYALPLALLAGMLEILPNLGPTLAAVPAVSIAYISGGPVIAGVVLLLSIVIQQLENHVIVPKVMKENANVSPLVAIIVILMGFKLGGVIGALLSIPTYIVLRTIYSTFFAPKKYIMTRDKLED